MKSQKTTRKWEHFLEEWDSMFSETIDPTRPVRMYAILRALNGPSRSHLRVLELGCGPGTLAARVLKRFRKARVVALDTDPVLIDVGRNALRPFGKRIKWVTADIRDGDWTTRLPLRRFDAVVSSLVLHWLEEDEIREVYERARTLLRPGGRLVNGDFLPAEGANRAAHKRKLTGNQRRSGQRGTEALPVFRRRWGKWWSAVGFEPLLRAAFQQRKIRLPGPLPPRRTSGPKSPASLEFHKQALRQAGFREVGVTWRERDFRVLVGVR
jgi:SAM-dependent methyltransferase